MKYILSTVLCLILVSGVYASDHLDTPTNSDIASADMCDLYAFPRKENGKTTLVVSMTVNSPAFTSKFSEKLEYTFHLRRVRSSSASFAADGENEYRITCTFKSDKKQIMHCVVSKINSLGEQKIVSSQVEVGNTTGRNQNGLRLYAGLRADPFFVDLVRINLPRLRNISYDDIGFPFPGIFPKNPLAFTEIKAIVVELDIENILGSDHHLYGVAGHTRMVTDHHGEKVVFNLDRIGRPEVTNFLIGQMSVTNEELNKIKKQWNGEKNSFALVESQKSIYRDAIKKGLENLDSKDIGEGITEGDWISPHPLLNILVDDFLIVDISKPADVNTKSYFEIETARLKKRSHKTCGGRTFNDDVVDKILTLHINGPNRVEPHRGDGIDKQPRTATNTFPYLAKP